MRHHAYACMHASIHWDRGTKKPGSAVKRKGSQRVTTRIEKKNGLLKVFPSNKPPTYISAFCTGLFIFTEFLDDEY